MKVRDVIKVLRKNGWFRVKAKGGHRQFKHPTKPGKVTVSGQLSDDVPAGTLSGIWKQAGLK